MNNILKRCIVCALLNSNHGTPPSHLQAHEQSESLEAWRFLHVPEFRPVPKTVTNDLAELSLIFSTNKPFSELPVVISAECLENELGDIYDGFAGVWYDPEREEMVVPLVDQESFAAQRESILSEITSRIAERMKPANIGITGETFKTIEARNTFQELHYIRDVLTPVIKERDDIVEPYINVEENKFSIAILKTAKRSDY